MMLYLTRFLSFKAAKNQFFRVSGNTLLVVPQSKHCKKAVFCYNVFLLLEEHSNSGIPKTLFGYQITLFENSLDCLWLILMLKMCSVGTEERVLISYECQCFLPTGDNSALVQ